MVPFRAVCDSPTILSAFVSFMDKVLSLSTKVVASTSFFSFLSGSTLLYASFSLVTVILATNRKSSFVCILFDTLICCDGPSLLYVFSSSIE